MFLSYFFYQKGAEGGLYRLLGHFAGRGESGEIGGFGVQICQIICLCGEGHGGRTGTVCVRLAFGTHTVRERYVYGSGAVRIRPGGLFCGKWLSLSTPYYI